MWSPATRSSRCVLRVVADPDLPSRQPAVFQPLLRRTFSMNFSVIPDITLQARPEPMGALTIGRLAGVVREMAAQPEDWGQLAPCYRPPVPVAPANDLWLSAWPPGHRAAPAGPGVL